MPAIWELKLTIVDLIGQLMGHTLGGYSLGARNLALKLPILDLINQARGAYNGGLQSVCSLGTPTTDVESSDLQKLHYSVNCLGNLLL